MRFAEQTYSAIESGNGFPYRRDIEPANRALELPYIYRQLLINNSLTPEENYTFLRWVYQKSLYIVQEKSHQIFTDGDLTPKELIETSAYQNYIQLIYQCPDTHETEDAASTDPTPTQPSQSFFSKVIECILNIFKWILKLFKW